MMDGQASVAAWVDWSLPASTVSTAITGSWRRSSCSSALRSS
jgi:hypothetical protein